MFQYKPGSLATMSKKVTLQRSFVEFHKEKGDRKKTLGHLVNIHRYQQKIIIYQASNMKQMIILDHYRIQVSFYLFHYLTVAPHCRLFNVPCIVSIHFFLTIFRKKSSFINHSSSTSLQEIICKESVKIRLALWPRL